LSARSERVVSRLAGEPALRTHLLSLVASREVGDEPELERFFSETFYGHTLAFSELTYTLERVRRFLEEHQLLRSGPGLAATPFGELTSELYLDPISAVLLKRAMERAPLGVRPFALLAAVAATPDLPVLFLRRGEEATFLQRFAEEEPELLVKPEEDGMTPPLETFLASLKTASILERWIEERPILEITQEFGIGAGDLKSKVEDATWLLFGLARLAGRFRREIARPVDALELRVQYGVGEELLELVRLKGIGRVRARLLFAAGYPDRESLRAAPTEAVARALKSPALAEQILRPLRPGVPRALPDGPEGGSESPGSASPTARPRRPGPTLEEFRGSP
ncbi:MAG: hypothetical protein ACREC5_07530, partial [Thermoplasmata archaeon]